MFNKKGQNTAEYAILITLVIAAAVGMQTYVKRGVQARIRDETRSFTSAFNSTDAAGDWATINVTSATMYTQYEPTQLSKQSTQQIITDTENSTITTAGSVDREMNKTTTQAVGDYQKYDYP